jgi:hypothetical protein
MFGDSFGGWGENDRINAVPAYAYLLANDADAVGFYGRTTSVSADVEFLFDPANPSDYDLFNVRYLLLPADQPAPVPATIVDTKGAFSLWQTPSDGFIEVVDALPPITADRTSLASAVEPWMRSSLPQEGRFPTIAFAGGTGAPATLPAQVPTEPAGYVSDQAVSLENGVVSGEVDLNRPAMVVLKSSFDPRWSVLVDGVELPTQMVAPSFVGRELPPGHHSIVFVYRPFPRYDVLIALGAITFVLLLIGPDRLSARSPRHRRRRPSRPSGAP